MALFEEFEPPLPKAEGDTSKKNSKIYLSRLGKLHLWIDTKRLNNSKKVFSRFFSGLKPLITSNKYLPHLVLLVLGLMVSATNVNQKIAAKAYNNELVALNPDTLFNVSESVDYYTNSIKNDSAAVERVILANVEPEGFAVNSVTVATEITDRGNVVDKASATSTDETLVDNSSKTIKYVVQNGDTLTGLGWKYEVKLATLKYVNNIDNENMIKPGVEIKIPPKGYEVSAKLIAKRESEKNAKIASANRNTTTRSSSSVRTTAVNANPGSKVNGYPYGWCTYYVATRRSVPTSWGDAKAWLSSAKRAGYSTGQTPVAGAIMVSSESFWGHVSYVESVNGNEFTISEMNYKGWGVTSRRTVSTGSGIIRGFIY